MEQSNNALLSVSRDEPPALIHYLNNTLAVIVGHCELLADHLEPDSEAAGRLRLILETVHSMAARINGHDFRTNPQPNWAAVSTSSIEGRDDNAVPRRYRPLHL